MLRSRRGDSQAFRELVEIYERRIFYYLRRLIEDDQEAWDLLQQTWLKVLRGICSLRDPRRFKSWLYTVARHTAADRLHALVADHARREEYGLEEIEDENPGPENFANANLVHFGLGKLPLDQREILTLFFLEKFSITDISDILKLPVGTVKSRLHRARAALRTVLAREGGTR